MSSSNFSAPSDQYRRSAQRSWEAALTADCAVALLTTSGRILTLHGDLDLATHDRLATIAANFAERCINELRNDRATTGDSMPDAIVDTGDVRFIDATSVGVLVTLHSTLADAGIRLRVRHPAALLRRVSGIYGLDAVLGLDPTPAPAPAPAPALVNDPVASVVADGAGPARSRSSKSLPVRRHLVLAPHTGAAL